MVGAPVPDGDALRWLDGRRVPPTAPLPSAPGSFTTVRSEHGRPALLDAHLARLARDAELLALPWPPPWDPAHALRALAAELGAHPHALRIAWTPPHLALAARAVPHGSESWTALVDAAGRTPPPHAGGAKTTARAVYTELHAEARALGADEALVVAADGELVEGTRTNLFLALDGELATPPLASGSSCGARNKAPASFPWSSSSRKSSNWGRSW
jgi:branched-subunit amino acid aminotransferase/4-amino-4-deoxychorismate lyase